MCEYARRAGLPLLLSRQWQSGLSMGLQLDRSPGGRKPGAPRRFLAPQ